MKNQLLLLEDVEGLGRSGDVATAKPGFIRNYLLPKKKAVFADKHTLRMQAKLKEEREKKAAVDRKAAEEMAAKMTGLTIETKVKVDPEGNMYGSVSQHDIVELLKKKGFEIEKRFVVFTQPIKTLGTHPISLKLNEGVPASFTLEVLSEEEPKLVKPKA